MRPCKTHKLCHLVSPTCCHLRSFSWLCFGLHRVLLASSQAPNTHAHPANRFAWLPHCYPDQTGTLLPAPLPHSHHFVADHFWPLITGQLPCKDLGSKRPSVLMLQNKTMSPFRGLYAKPCMAHSEYPACACGGSNSGHRSGCAAATPRQRGHNHTTASTCHSAKYPPPCANEYPTALVWPLGTGTLGKTVSPPSSTSDRYMRPVASRFPPMSSACSWLK